MHIVAIGNPIDGVELFGPFGSLVEAEEWAAHICDADWWITELTLPNKM